MTCLGSFQACWMLRGHWGSAPEPRGTEPHRVLLSCWGARQCSPLQGVFLCAPESHQVLPPESLCGLQGGGPLCSRQGEIRGLGRGRPADLFHRSAPHVDRGRAIAGTHTPSSPWSRSVTPLGASVCPLGACLGQRLPSEPMAVSLLPPESLAFPPSGCPAPPGQVSTGLPPPVPAPRPTFPSATCLGAGAMGGRLWPLSPASQQPQTPRGGQSCGASAGAATFPAQPPADKGPGARAPGRPRSADAPARFIESSSAGRDSIKKPFAAACWPPAVPLLCRRSVVEHADLAANELFSRPGSPWQPAPLTPQEASP